MEEGSDAVVHDSLVTGCAGFIGSHLVERLIDRGDRVVGIDSFDDYYAPEAKRRNLAQVAHHPRFTLLEGNVRELPLRHYLHSGILVCHLAAQPGVRGSWGKDFHRYVENNVLATQMLLEAVKEAKADARFIYASSSSIYGEAPGGPTSEDTLPRPISPYGMTKLAGEHLTRLYGRVGGLTTVSLRFFTVYGPRQRPDMAFHRFFRAVLDGRPIEVYGDGRQLRDFTFVGDIVEGILAASEADGTSEVYNLGGGDPVPLETAIRYVGKAAGKAPQIQSLPVQAGDPQATWADIRRARRALHFRPRVSLREGLERQWQWHTAEARHVPLAA
jgi:nucleoside-diphosphate-sugar epimerase